MIFSGHFWYILPVRVEEDWWDIPFCEWRTEKAFCVFFNHTHLFSLLQTAILVICMLFWTYAQVDSCSCAKQLSICHTRLLVMKLRVKQLWPLSYINSEPVTMDGCHSVFVVARFPFCPTFLLHALGQASGALDQLMSFPWHKAALRLAPAAKERSFQPGGIHRWLTNTEQLCCQFSCWSQHRWCTQCVLSSYKQQPGFRVSRLLHMVGCSSTPDYCTLRCYAEHGHNCLGQ